MQLKIMGATIRLTEVIEEAPESFADMKVLVLNSSDNLARQITLELSYALPGCALIFAPTMALGKLILSKRKINLIVSCPSLPDGNVEELSSFLESLQEQPDLVIVGQKGILDDKLGSRYYMQREQIINDTVEPKIHRLQSGAYSRTECIKSLGADFRNDLNNPLQAIVAMLYVAKADQVSDGTEKALSAIENAAKGMAQVVKNMEERMLTRLAE